MKFTLHVPRRGQPKHRLDLDKIIETTGNLAVDIHGRLPGSSLSHLAEELLLIANVTEARLRRVRQPIIAIRASSWIAAIVGLAGLGYLVDHLHARWGFQSISEFFEATDAGFNLLILIAGALWTLLTLETRIKSKVAIGYIGELREFVHVIDLTQLYYTPELYRPRSESPQAPYVLDDSYLLFCTQMLGVIGNLASLYNRDAAGDSILRAAYEVEMLAIAISSKHFSKAEMVRMMVVASQAPHAG